MVSIAHSVIKVPHAGVCLTAHQGVLGGKGSVWVVAGSARVAKLATGKVHASALSQLDSCEQDTLITAALQLLPCAKPTVISTTAAESCNWQGHQVLTSW